MGTGNRFREIKFDAVLLSFCLEPDQPNKISASTGVTASGVSDFSWGIFSDLVKTDDQGSHIIFRKATCMLLIIKGNKTQDKPPPTPSIPGCGLIPGRAQIANSRGRSEVTFAGQKSRRRRCCFAWMCNQPDLGVFGSFVKIFLELAGVAIRIRVNLAVDLDEEGFLSRRWVVVTPIGY